MLPPTTYDQAIDWYIALLKTKAIRVRLHQPRSGGTLWDAPEVYAVDHLMSLAREEVAALEEFLCMRDREHFTADDMAWFTNMRSLCFQNWTEFEYLPDAFPADPSGEPSSTAT